MLLVAFLPLQTSENETIVVLYNTFSFSSVISVFFLNKFCFLMMLLFRHFACHKIKGSIFSSLSVERKPIVDVTTTCKQYFQ